MEKSLRQSTANTETTAPNHLVRLGALALFVGAGAPTHALAQDRVITTPVSIAQDQLAAGAYTPSQVVQSGRQFFGAAYLPSDGHGEGPTGPRSGIRQAFWGTAVAGSGLEIPFVRVNGLDAQACFGCHNSAGTYVPPGELHRTQKPGGLGGAADFASVLLANSAFPSVGGAADTQPRLTHVVRAPPKTYGTGYAQELAIEMSETLLAIEAGATAAAAAFPGVQVTRHLIAKGVDFGDITITCPNATCASPVRDVSQISGVSADLIVRPLQHKGITATLRSFCKSALDFHFSIQPVEVVGVNTDCDADGLRNEMAVDNVSIVPNAQSLQVQQSLGNVAALAAFTGMLRPPVSPSFVPGTRGEVIFDRIGCTSCHVQSLTTRRGPLFRIQLASPARACPNTAIYGSANLGSFSEVEATRHSVLETISAQATQDALRSTQVGKASTLPAISTCPTGFYCIDLTNPGTLPPEFGHRLPANADLTVTVPLYSDLKRHDLGAYLAQQSPNQVDDGGNIIPNDEWLTTKLWGVADNGPWLHDGRARTLEEAIIMHDGADGNANDGEAVAVINNFQALSATDKAALIDFLLTLSVPNP